MGRSVRRFAFISLSFYRQYSTCQGRLLLTSRKPSWDVHSIATIRVKLADLALQHRQLLFDMHTLFFRYRKLLFQLRIRKQRWKLEDGDSVFFYLKCMAIKRRAYNLSAAPCYVVYLLSWKSNITYTTNWLYVYRTNKHPYSQKVNHWQYLVVELDARCYTLHTEDLGYRLQVEQRFQSTKQ